MDIRVEDKNLLDYSDWSTDLSGSTVNFLEYVDKSYNYRVFDTDPFGNTTPIWKTTSSGLSGWTGGIVAAPSVCGVNIDNTKIYRFSTWTKRKKIGINGKFYFGVRSLNNCSQDYLIRINDGLSSKNFYLYDDNFSNLNTSMPEDIWVLVVGYVLPSTYTGSTDTNYYSKIYNIDGGNTATSPYNYKWSGTTNAVYFRTYGPYNETSLSAETYSCYPRIDLLDGTEPSINTLLTNEGMWRSGTTYIKVEDQNLLDYSDWSTDLSGSTSEFTAVTGFNAKLNQYRQLDTDPFGNINYIWVASGVTATGATYGGGYLSSGVTIDNTKTYRISQWCNRFNTGDTSNGYYFGFWTYDINGTLTGATRSDGAYNTNYYTYQNISANMTGVNGWFLTTGYLMPYTWTGNTAEYQGKIYYNNGWTHTSNAYNYRFNVNAKYLAIRSYSPYNAPSYSGTKFCYPRIDLVDGTEPSINTLLNNEGMWRSGTTMIYVDDVWKNT